LSLLQVENISKSYKQLQVLHQVSVDVRPGERHVIIGPNGAGKTTLFHCITGLTPIDDGKVIWEGEEIHRLYPHRLVHLGLSRTFQKNNLFGNLSVEENLHLAIAARKPYRWQLLKSLLAFPDLKEETESFLEQWEITALRGVLVNNLSYGEQRLLEVLLALASHPRILLLDEPTSGMSPAETAQTAAMIRRLPRSVSLLVIEHDMEVVFSIADRITVLHHGEVIAQGKPEEIRNDGMVRHIYFGGGAKIHA